MGNDRESEYELAVADQPEAEERRAAHAPFRVVEEAVYAGVCELSRDLVKKKVRIEPAEVPEDLVTGHGGPDMQCNQELLSALPN
jgi:hypothetical protein